jgi:pyruvate formate-lyase activating enzyme-like uncharacterized protein
MKKLRLLVTEKCNRNCVGCCNNDVKPSGVLFDVDECLDYQLIMITGGEPLLFPEMLCLLLETLKKNQRCPPIYLYTAFCPSISHLKSIIPKLDGITFTIHDQQGIEDFIKLNRYLYLSRLSLDKRLNVFINIPLPIINLYGWEVKFIDWIKDCPLPEGEEFKQLKCLWV